VGTSADFDVRLKAMPDDAEVLHVSGELDMATAPRFEEAVAASTARTLVIDLSDCTFLDSAGIRGLVGSVRALSGAGRRACISCDNPSIVRVLEITGVDTLLAVYPTVDDAL
jgi:anti-sigma B factor antagonist